MIDQRLISDVHEITKRLLGEAAEVSRKYNEPILGVVALMQNTMAIGVDLYAQLSVPFVSQRTVPSIPPQPVKRNIFKEALEDNLGAWEDAEDPADNIEESAEDDGKYCKDIPGFPGYKCTRDGDVIGPRGMLTPSLTIYGRYVSPYVDGTTKTTAVHTLMMRTFRPKEWAPGKAVIHLDGDKYNNKLENLAFKGDK